MNILVICANPINKSSSTRAFYTYFGDRDKIKIAQFYSNDQKIDEEFCCTYFNLTDSIILKRMFNKNCIGRNESNRESNYGDTRFIGTLKKIGKKGWPLIQLFRKALWKKNRWMTDDLISWAHQFKPDLIFYHNSDAFFLGEIAIELSKLFSVPLILEISDDYYFNNHFSLSPFYHLYRKKYKKHFENCIKHATGYIFISEKMKRKYEEFFEIKGECIHISSEFQFETNQNFQTDGSFNYFGNIGLGRWKTIKTIANQLKKHNDETILDVYCPRIGNSIVSKIKNIQNVRYCGSLEYDDLKRKIFGSKYLLLVESFSKKNIKDVKFSLSTKVADYISTGVPIIAVGPKGSGTIDFLEENNLAIVINKIDNFYDSFGSLNNRKNELSRVVSNALRISKEQFSLEVNIKKSYQYFLNCVKK